MIDPLLKELESDLRTAVDKFKQEIQSVRSNRPSVGLIEDINVECYGQMMQVKAVGSLSIRPPRDIIVTPWDKSVIGAVAKGIESAKAGFSVTNDGISIIVSLPPLTDERRAELSKLVKKMAESSRIYVRSERDESIKKLKAAEDSSIATEDEVFRAKEKIQKSVDQANENIEANLNAKLKEIGE